MAEVATLTSAHDHARLAGQQTAKLDWKSAIEEHQQAAGDFSRTSRSTSDREALRILHLLEIQHQRLAEIIYSKDGASSPEPQHSLSAVDTPSDTKTSDAVKSKQAESPKTPTHTASRLRSTIRESSPSLARDIASRRGIPQPSSTHISAAAQARTRQLSPESARRAAAGPAPRIPTSVMDSRTFTKPEPATPTAAAADDDGFTNFYNNLTTGTMSKLSSVLAFAGLPLSVEEPEPAPVKHSRRTVKANTDPDVKRIFSKAALNAIEDDHQQRGLQGQAFGPTESFYVVQTGGGTLSYADITKTHTQASIIGGDDEEAFVDAREAQPPSPKHRMPVKPQRGSFGNARTSEELELENTTLKQTLEQLASRLANFEAHAQDASMAALTQSMASLRQPGGGAAADAQDRVKLLETKIEQQAEQREKLEELAKKQEKKIRAYHSKWEEIKKNAREKEKSKREKQQGTEEDEASSSAA